MNTLTAYCKYNVTFMVTDEPHVNGCRFDSESPAVV